MTRMRSVVAVVLLVASVPTMSIASAADDPAHLGSSIHVVNPPDTSRRVDSAMTFSTPGRGPNTVRVEVLVESGESEAALNAIDDVGGRVVAAAPDVMLVDVPALYASDLASSTGAISSVRDPAMINLPPTDEPAFTNSVGPGELKTLVGADTWHAAGQTGAEVRVGIVDFFDQGAWTAAQGVGALPAPSGVFCRVVGSPCDIWTSFETHGVAVAEGIRQIAPGVSLYLATVGTVTDLAAAVEWFDANGVTIISRSLGAYLDSAGDGTGPLNAVVDDAVSRGMAWFNAAGNHASDGTFDGKYWRGTWVDTNTNGWLDFAPGIERMRMWCASAIQGFRWSDWAGNATDYDVVLYALSGGELFRSERDQATGSQPPLELISPHSIDCGVHEIIEVSVLLWSEGNGTAGDVLELMVNNGGLEFFQNAYSASGPVVDSANPGALAVGAIDPGDGGWIAPYSSQGPTNDNRVNPGVVAPSCYPTTASAPNCFNGTSAAAPVAAGVAALISGADVATTPAAITSYIRTHAQDAGAAGEDNVFGAGRLKLGSPPVPLDADADRLVLIDPSQGRWHYYDNGGNEAFSIFFGNPGDYPIMGDWDCDGIETPGMYRQSDGYVYLRNTNTQGIADIRFFFGNPGDVPIAGDFNGDGCSTVSIYRPSNQTFYIINKLGKNDGGLGAATSFYVFGNPGDKPFVGDFDGDGLETVGLHRESTGLVYFRNSHSQGNADKQFIFGDPGDRLIAGDWNSDGLFSPALFRPSSTIAYFRFTNSQGNADAQFNPAGSQSGWLPVTAALD